MSESDQIPPDDHALMRRIRGDDEHAFRHLVERHQRPLLNFFARMGVRNHGEDLAQKTFLRLWNYRVKYKPSAKFTTFLYTLARHVWIDHVRQEGRFQLFTERYQQEIPNQTDGGIRRLRARLDVQEALATLTPKLREVLVLMVYQGFTYAEAAEILRIPEGTVKSRVFNALATLKGLYDKPAP